MIKPSSRRKLPECDRCLLYSHNSFLVCAVHPLLWGKSLKHLQKKHFNYVYFLYDVEYSNLL